MSRREVKLSIDLDKIIPEYKQAKNQESKYKKLSSSLNDQIKDAFASLNIEEYEVGDIRASITSKPKEDFNELQAIEILRKELSPELFNQVVKTKEYIDDDEFENLTYSGKIKADILQPAITPLPPTITLRLGKAKK